MTPEKDRDESGFATVQTLAASSVDRGSGDVDRRWAEVVDAESRYSMLRMLGAGGMGEVRLCEDRWLERPVAMKVIHRERSDSERQRSRFLREARVQARLEHPSFVPVHDIGSTRDGLPCFTMRLVEGLTLSDVIEGLVARDPAMRAQFSRRRLLSVMSSVCLAIAFAHARGVIHRDLKPANVMLGAFGEVYVLDWGVAKLVSETDLTVATRDRATGLCTDDGVTLGTPGYMAPEQVRDSRAVDQRADIYALGAILFELLSGEPLHAEDDVPLLLKSTLASTSDRIERIGQTRDLPPELVEICRRASALAPADRFDSARAMHEAVERYLDGERDLERREVLARRYSVSANLNLAMAARGGVSAEDHRVRALSDLSRALALVPTHEGAASALSEALDAGPAGADAESAGASEGAAGRRATELMLALSLGAVWLLSVPLLIYADFARPSVWIGLVLLGVALTGVGHVALRVVRALRRAESALQVERRRLQQLLPPHAASVSAKAELSRRSITPSGLRPRRPPDRETPR